ncbi:MAG: tRNA dihydrouridine synthase DusB [Alphaproteobacteria bacterium]|nr:tRNA dihydrouridine synthase DusB [Alphaproteobacteria bacterium]
MTGMLPKQVFLAPMAGITDKPMRRIVHAKSGNDVALISEMVAINALSRKNAKTYRIADVRDEPYPVIVQLVGADEVLFADAAQLAEELGAAGIDINMGCPVRKIITGGAGSALMKNPEQAAKIIKSVKNAVKLPVSVKFRKGWDNNSVNATDFAKMCEASGAEFITVHGRTRAQGYSGTADWNIIKEVKTAVKIPVVGNGDVTSPQSAAEMIKQTGCDGVMIGRAALGAPWLTGEIAKYLKTGSLPQKQPAQEVKNTLLKHISLLTEYYGEKLALALSRKYVCWYSKNFHDAKRFRENYMKINDYQTAVAEINAYFNQNGEEE